MKTAAIDLSFERVSKRYRIQDSAAPARGLAGRIRHRLSGTRTDFWAVRDISFDVRHGEVLGIIGHNGAGKSTLLKLLSGITAPTTGAMKVRGRIAALLEVGSGFHPELTGRENVFLSGSILGMKRREIHAKLDSIVDFAEIRPFIDEPVKRYSSGMYVRLGFSIAAHLEPDVLLLDEVLAVGDAAFQSKCKDRVLEMKSAETTIIFISHDLTAIEDICDRVLVMKRGEITYDGTPASAIQFYRDSAHTAAEAPYAETDGRVEITSIQVSDESGAPVTGGQTGGPLRIRVEYIAHAAVAGAQFMILFALDATEMCIFASEHASEWFDIAPGRGAVEFACDELLLKNGIYRVDFVIDQKDAVGTVLWIKCMLMLHVGGGVNPRGMFYHPSTITRVNAYQSGSTHLIGAANRSRE